MYELSHVTADEWNNNIDINLSTVLVADNYYDAVNNMDRDFSNALNMKGEASHFSGSIRSYNVSENPCGLFDKPICATLYELEEALG